MTTSSEKPTGDIAALTSLRFIAAFYVFLFHIQIRVPITEISFLKLFLEEGAVGMAIFFMLSGFILAHRYSGRSFSDREYVVARFARIYPTYALSAILALPMLYFQIGELRFGTASLIAQIVVIVVSAVAMVQAWIPMMFTYINNNANWSLSVEAFFYLSFVLIIGRIEKFSDRGLLFFLGSVYAFSLLGPLAYYAFEDRPEMGLQIFYAMPIFRLPEFLAGIAVYLISRRMPRMRAWGSGKVAFMLLVFSIVYLGTVAQFLPIFVGHNWIMIPLISSWLICLSGDLGAGRKVAENPVLVYLGKTSYCFYLFQFHVLVILGFLLPTKEMGGFYYLLVALPTLILVASFFHHSVEIPMQKYLRRRLTKDRVAYKESYL